jgi:DNA-3-methyladenine glycosylase II
MTPKALAFLRRTDRTLARLIQRVGPPPSAPPRKGQSPFQALVEAVVYQQLTGKAAATILGRVKALFPGRFPVPADLLKMPARKLRAAGLSYAKIAAVKDIAAKTLEGLVPTSRVIARMKDEEIVERLTSIRGVGRWTVEMLLMFKLGRPDILPATDYGVRKGIALIYRLKELPSPKEVLVYGEKWKPYRTTASWYLWRGLDTVKP